MTAHQRAQQRQEDIDALTVDLIEAVGRAIDNVVRLSVAHAEERSFNWADRAASVAEDLVLIRGKLIEQQRPT